jgi:hypothetical protein
MWNNTRWLVIGVILGLVWLTGGFNPNDDRMAGGGYRARHLRQRNAFDIYERSDYRGNPYAINQDQYTVYPVNFASHPHAYMQPLRQIH